MEEKIIQIISIIIHIMILFILKVEPHILSDKGNTEIKIKGYGFANKKV